jgi:hypothetical protein
MMSIHQVSICVIEAHQLLEVVMALGQQANCGMVKVLGMLIYFAVESSQVISCAKVVENSDNVETLSLSSKF